MNLKIRSLLLMGFLLLSALSSTSYALPMHFEGSDVATSNDVDEAQAATTDVIPQLDGSVQQINVDGSSAKDDKDGHYYITMSGGDWDRYVAELPDPDDATVILARSSAKGNSQKKKSRRCVAPFTGVASYYNLNGNRTASGEIFRGKLMTAAHKTLPLGTVLIVTNMNNNKSVEVRVNDRGPFIKGRVLDLSKGAAERIGMLGSGHAQVSVKPSC